MKIKTLKHISIFYLLTCLNRYQDSAMSFMKKKSLSILKICQSLLVAKKGKGPFIYYVSFLFGHPSPLPKHIYSIESRVKRDIF